MAGKAEVVDRRTENAMRKKRTGRRERGKGVGSTEAVETAEEGRPITSWTTEVSEPIVRLIEVDPESELLLLRA